MTDAINSHSRRMYNAQKKTPTLELASPMDDPRVKALVEALREYACDCDYACEQLNGTCGDTARAALSALEEYKLDEPLHRHTWNPPTNFGSKEE